MNDIVFFTLLAAAGSLHAGLIYLNRHVAAGTGRFVGSRAAAVITQLANVAAVLGWGGLALFIAVARGQPASYSVPTLLGAPLVFIPVALLGHAISVALRIIQAHTAEASIRGVLSMTRKAGSGVVAATAFLGTAVRKLLVMVTTAVPQSVGGQSEHEGSDEHLDTFNYRTGEYDGGTDPFGLYHDKRYS